MSIVSRSASYQVARARWLQSCNVTSSVTSLVRPLATRATAATVARTRGTATATGATKGAMPLSSVATPKRSMAMAAKKKTKATPITTATHAVAKPQASASAVELKMATAKKSSPVSVVSSQQPYRVYTAMELRDELVRIGCGHDIAHHIAYTIAAVKVPIPPKSDNQHVGDAAAQAINSATQAAAVPNATTAASDRAAAVRTADARQEAESGPSISFTDTKSCTTSTATSLSPNDVNDNIITDEFSGQVPKTAKVTKTESVTITGTAANMDASSLPITIDPIIDGDHVDVVIRAAAVISPPHAAAAGAAADKKPSTTTSASNKAKMAAASADKDATAAELSSLLGADKREEEESAPSISYVPASEPNPPITHK